MYECTGSNVCWLTTGWNVEDISFHRSGSIFPLGSAPVPAQIFPVGYQSQRAVYSGRWKKMWGRDVTQGWPNRVPHSPVTVIGLNDEHTTHANPEFLHEICYTKAGLEGCFSIWTVIYKNDRSLEGLPPSLWGKSLAEEGCQHRRKQSSEVLTTSLETLHLAASEARSHS